MIIQSVTDDSGRRWTDPTLCVWWRASDASGSQHADTMSLTASPGIGSPRCIPRSQTDSRGTIEPYMDSYGRYGIRARGGSPSQFYPSRHPNPEDPKLQTDEVASRVAVFRAYPARPQHVIASALAAAFAATVGALRCSSYSGHARSDRMHVQRCSPTVAGHPARVSPGLNRCDKTQPNSPGGISVGMLISRRLASQVANFNRRPWP